MNDHLDGEEICEYDHVNVEFGKERKQVEEKKKALEKVI